HDQGGVFELESVAVAMFESVHLVSNHASAGGAMVVRDSTVIIRDSHFEANIAAFSGGALHVDDASDVSIARTVFLDNITSGSGGAIGSQYGSDVRMASSVFAGNVANNGNAISLHDTSLALTFVTLAGSPMGAAISMPDEGFDVTM